MAIERLADVVFPARDQSFASVVRAVSEPESGPHADNLMSNEDSYPRVAGQIAKLAPPGSVYLGVGPDQNLTYIAHAGPVLAFVADFRRRNALVHLLHKALMMLSPTRVDYLTRLLARTPRPMAENLVAAFRDAPLDRALLDRQIRDVAEFLRPYGLIQDREWADLATIQRRLAGPGLNARFLALPMYPTLGHFLAAKDSSGKPAHFTSSDELYGKARAIQMGDRVLPIVANVVGDRAMPALGRWLRDRSLPIGVLYISDVEYFLIRGGTYGRFLEVLRSLPRADGALIVRTSTRPIEHPGRVAGDSSTTMVGRIAPMLSARRLGLPTSHEMLFQNP